MSTKVCEICKKKLGLLKTRYHLYSANVVCCNCAHNAMSKLNLFDVDGDIDTLNKIDIKQLSKIATEDVTSEYLYEVLHKRNEVIIEDPKFVMERCQSAGDFHADFHSKILMLTVESIPKGTCYRFSEITSYIPHLVTREGKSYNGITRAAVGGILLGPAGAVVGAVTASRGEDLISRIAITVYLNDGSSFEVNILKNMSGSEDIEVVNESKRQFEDITILLDRILDINKMNENKETSMQNDQSFSIADEIIKYKELLDMGIINEEQFETQKEKLLQ
ncbi:SHOCT domain-containing protein [Companilactobacillus mishanensis]|nr:SHOCT domain-containing protein [Companilactobacillus mishanensis]